MMMRFIPTQQQRHKPRENDDEDHDEDKDYGDNDYQLCILFYRAWQVPALRSGGG